MQFVRVPGHLMDGLNLCFKGSGSLSERLED
jgi:hypothetical protein